MLLRSTGKGAINRPLYRVIGYSPNCIMMLLPYTHRVTSIESNIDDL